MSDIYINGKPVSALRVVDLKEELDKRGLSKSGKKDELVLRLQSFLEVNPEDGENGGADGEEEDVIEAERRAAEERRKLEDQREEQRRQEEEKKREEERLKEEELRKEQELREIKEKEAEQQRMAEQKRLEEEARKELLAETQRKEQEEKERARVKAAEEEKKRKEEEKERRRKEEEEQKQKEEKRRREKERQEREEEEERKHREKVKQELEEQKEKEKKRREQEKREEEEEKERRQTEQKEKEKERKRLESEQKEKEQLKRKAEEERREEEEREEKKQKLSAKIHQNGTENENKEQRLKEELLKRLREQKEEKEKREEEKKKKTEDEDVHADTTLQLEIDSTDLVSEEPAKEKTPPRPVEVSAGQVTSLRRIGNRGPDSEKSRKRGWGASRRLSSTENIDISSNLLKDLVPDAANLLSKDVAIHEEEKENGHSDADEDDDEIGPSLPKDKLETVKEKVIRKKIRLEDDPEESPLIVVHNLTRPFTVMQLKNMLNRTGTVEDFWINKVKSKCCVKYTSVAQASETRMALNGITWPMDNKTPLAVYYTTEEQLERFKGSPEEPVRIVTSNGAASQGTRDWDKEKLERTERRRERSEEQENKPSQPIKSLEELFNKTKTTPALYWKPLSEETIKRKEEARNKRMLAAINKKKSKSRSKS